ncbi:MAG: class I SAM-dependent methyltransferase [Candidatus Binatia bacterium]|nr:class I SAM-dependent methyltransferase [Candidatus Binatia bacterium]
MPALGFRWLTPLYDTVVRASTKERTFKHARIEQAHNRPQQRVQDLGCGTGTLAIWVKQQRPEAEVTGTYADRDVLRLALRKADQASVSVRFDQAFAERLPYRDAVFDRVVSSLFFHHLSWQAKLDAAREAFRVLKQGGELYVADWGGPTNALMRALFLSIQLLDGFANTRDHVRGKLASIFEQAQFVQVGTVRTFSTVFGTIALYRAVKPAS